MRYLPIITTLCTFIWACEPSDRAAQKDGAKQEVNTTLDETIDGNIPDPVNNNHTDHTDNSDNSGNDGEQGDDQDPSTLACDTVAIENLPSATCLDVKDPIIRGRTVMSNSNANYQHPSVTLLWMGNDDSVGFAHNGTAAPIANNIFALQVVESPPEAILVGLSSRGYFRTIAGHRYEVAPRFAFAMIAVFDDVNANGIFDCTATQFSRCEDPVIGYSAEYVLAYVENNAASDTLAALYFGSCINMGLHLSQVVRQDYACTTQCANCAGCIMDTSEGDDNSDRGWECSGEAGDLMDDCLEGCHGQGRFDWLKTSSEEFEAEVTVGYPRSLRDMPNLF